ncbi:MAG: response regulator [Ferruginibacter sp.]|uniref:response regulator n=1 Tax=Ferruginibacter sp. TaxID=1940288 RepID=UPI00265B3941|nr:response regulator [Ferruginibacter sp.]MDB5278236.1 response regulator [Ferruginibacter sp.]
MNRNQPIIIIEDDEDDQIIFRDTFCELGYKNQLHFFLDGQLALDFLNGQGKDITPFLILSDINMPKLDGFALRDKIRMDAALQVRCIPYLFFTTSVTQNSVIYAYEKSIQGFFLKQNSVEGLKEVITVIMEYWKHCAAPNNFISK